MVVGLLHPGEMGAAIGAQLVGAGHETLWCRAGRSARSAERASEAGLGRVDSLADLLAASEVVLSVCPPASAGEVANAVAESGFAGVFVDANAISPQRMDGIADRLTGEHLSVVDGAIIGPPPGGSRRARLYLSGPAPAARHVHALFDGTLAEPVLLGERVGQASALKIAFGSFQKTTRALAAVSHALADEYGVTAELLSEAHWLGPNALIDRDHFPIAAARAWRWAPEMLEGAASFAELGLPDDLATGSAAVMRRWETDKDDRELDVDTALRHLREPGDRS